MKYLPVITWQWTNTAGIGWSSHGAKDYPQGELATLGHNRHTLAHPTIKNWQLFSKMTLGSLQNSLSDEDEPSTALSGDASNVLKVFLRTGVGPWSPSFNPFSPRTH